MSEPSVISWSSDLDPASRSSILFPVVGIDVLPVDRRLMLWFEGLAVEAGGVEVAIDGDLEVRVLNDELGYELPLVDLLVMRVCFGVISRCCRLADARGLCRGKGGR